MVETEDIVIILFVVNSTVAQNSIPTFAETVSKPTATAYTVRKDNDT